MIIIITNAAGLQDDIMLKAIESVYSKVAVVNIPHVGIIAPDRSLELGLMATALMHRPIIHIAALSKAEPLTMEMLQKKLAETAPPDTFVLELQKFLCDFSAFEELVKVKDQNRTWPKSTNVYQMKQQHFLKTQFNRKSFHRRTAQKPT